jgi:hypothetical protein
MGATFRDWSAAVCTPPSVTCNFRNGFDPAFENWPPPETQVRAEAPASFNRVPCSKSYSLGYGYAG